jgi:cell division protein FtsB
VGKAKNLFIRAKGQIAVGIMAQLQFKLQNNINELEERNEELVNENAVLKIKVETLNFEIDLLKDLVGFEDDENKDAIIVSLKKVLVEKDSEIAQLKAELTDKTAEVANLNMTFNAATANVEVDDLLVDLNEVFDDDTNEKMGEDTGKEIEPPKKKQKAVKTSRKTGQKGRGPKKVLPNGKISYANPEARKYTSRRTPVTDPVVLDVLDRMYKDRMGYKRKAGIGQKSRHGVRYAHYYGRLNKAGDIGVRRTVVLSSEKKVYMLEENGDHVELRWQNDKSVKSPSYGGILLTGDGENGSYECSLKYPFITELCVYI